MAPHKEMTISRNWLIVAVITFLVGFTILIYLATVIHREHPPIPDRVINQEGRTLFTGDDVMAGQHLFQKYGLMQYGTIFGHGAYLGPDFTAQYIHFAGEAMVAFYKKGGATLGEAEARTRADFKNNTYNPTTKTVTFSSAQSASFDRMLEFYRSWFMQQQKGDLQKPSITDTEELRLLTSYFAWGAWTATTLRPGAVYSYTNNWPPAPLAGNTLTAEALLWSVLSLIALLGGTGIVLFIFGRYNILGWHREDNVPQHVGFRSPELVPLTPSQRATPWYFLVVAGLFLLQGLLGGVNAHYHAEPGGFYGLNLANILPYNLSRMWHLQLALFFVSASFLAMGIFIAPMIAGREPKHQDKLALTLFAAVVIVVLGSLAGEAASITNAITKDGPWFWVGAQGWEYLDLGRLWQILLVTGMFIWVIILVRGVKSRLPEEHPGNMPYLFLYSAFSIPLFYMAGMVFGKNVNFAVADFWRFWVVHLWVEDFLELFTTIMVAYVFVLLGVVRLRVAITVVYLDIILYSIGGVIGTMHHLYFSGAPSLHMALGAFFSAMEVIPLVLLTYEAWRFMQLGAPPGERSLLGTSTAEFPHKWAVMFLIAVGFWNFLGAGVFGFLINLPVVSYYEIGTQFTANHGHGALMGVYGMLALGFFMFVARYFIPRDKGCDRAMQLSFWSLNIGLAWMLFINLFPVGAMQLTVSVKDSYWAAREPSFFQKPLVMFFEWLRLPGDALFIVGGIIPVVYLAVRMFAQRNRPGTTIGAGDFTQKQP